MLAIRFEFTANRYHATQWGRHVNEGVLEWPPSPWRMLRAIVAVWRRTLPDIPVERIVPILEALASERPAYHLPPASTSHTRHYMPYNEGNRERTTLVIDSFVAIQPECPVFAVWQNADMDEHQTDDLRTILGNMPYLGRAESWVDASIAMCPPAELNSKPMEDGGLPDGDLELVRTLVPRSPIRMEDLEVETAHLRRAGRIAPEGAQWWMYTRPSNCFTEFRSRDVRRANRGEGAQVVRFALSGNVLPMVKDTLKWGELARRTMMARYGRQSKGANSPTLSGKDKDGTPMRGHKHAFYFPTDENGDGSLDHLTVWVPEGLSADEFRAVVSAKRLNPCGGRKPIQIVYQSHGAPDDFEGVSPLFADATHWRSLTPYNTTRHIKFRGPRDENGSRTIILDSPEDQIQREVSLRWQGDCNLIDVGIQHSRSTIQPMLRGRSVGLRPFDFYRYRSGGGSNGGKLFNVSIEFAQPVRGPIALGFACHYGLGLFVPMTDS